MDRSKRDASNAAALHEKRLWQVLAFGGMAVALLLAAVLLATGRDTKTVFVPPGTANANKPFWVAEATASPEYFQMTADYVLQLALTCEPKSSAYNIDRLMAITHPSLQGALKSSLTAVADKMKGENVTQAFYMVEYHTAAGNPDVGVKGTLKTWVGDKQVSSREVAYKLSFSMGAGRVWLVGFKESTLNDPLTETGTGQAAQPQAQQQGDK
jgi:conjugal transfer pilus assembly protein TraE